VEGNGAGRESAKLTLEAPGEETQVVELPPGAYVVTCSPERYVASEQHYPTKGTSVVTIKTRGVDE
jgi:hypothetical protein